MNTKQIKKLQGRINRIKKKLSQLGDFRPGTLSKQYNVCGNPTCRCKDPAHPKKHGPYYQISYTYRGKSRTEFVRREFVGQVQKEIRNYTIFRQLTKEWIDISLEIARLRREAAKSKGSNDNGSQDSRA
jgi:hypothetical protein